MRSTLVTTLTLLTLVLAAPSSTAQEEPDARPWEQTLIEARDLMAAGKIAEATVLAGSALEEAEAHLAQDDVELVGPLMFVSTMHIIARDMEAALPPAERANAIAEAALVESCSRVATTLKAVGAIHMQQGEFDQALAAYERAVQLSESALGPDHTETAKHLGNLGAMLLQLERNEEAEALLLRSRDIWAGRARPHPVYAAGDMKNLAALRMRQDRPDDALSLYAEAVALQESAFEPVDPRLRSTLADYADLLRQCNRTEEAAAVEERLEDP